ncbi:unannotated protein [freshwater metagenome]|uniref:Unannotated protein n=1 Tax=freshwater metagenome TaxID=449393 RepID=A0A6J7I7I1_9ZZZZ
MDNRPNAARRVGEVRGERLEAFVTGADHHPVAVEAHDVGLAVERVEHDGDATVLAQMRDGLGAAADAIEIGHLVRTQHYERPRESFR